MPSLQQQYATSGRPSPIRMEDINQARLPSLYAARAQGISSQETDLAEQALGLRRREADMQRQQEGRALLTSGANTALQGAGLLEVAYPGSLSSIGSKFLPNLLGGTSATAAPIAATAGAAAGALPGGTGLAAAYPLFGAGMSALEAPAALGAAAPTALGAAAPTVSGAAAASGLGAAPAASSTVASTTAPALSASAPAGAGAGAATIGAALGPAGIGFGAGAMFGQPIGKLLGLKGRAAGAAGGALGGAATGALAGTALFPGIGTLLGGALGGITGALGGAVSIIATVTYGPDSPETALAQRYRRKYIGATTYLGYRALFDPLAKYLDAHPESKESVKIQLVDPMLKAMRAELQGLPPSRYRAERSRLKGILQLCREIGRAQRQRKAA